MSTKSKNRKNRMSDGLIDGLTVADNALLAAIDRNGTTPTAERVPLSAALMERANVVAPSFTATCFDIDGRQYSATIPGTDGKGTGEQYSEKCAAADTVAVQSPARTKYADPTTGKEKAIGKQKGAVSGNRAAADLAHHVYPIA